MSYQKIVCEIFNKFSWLMWPLMFLLAMQTVLLASTPPDTGALKGIITAVGANAQRYNIPGASLRLRRTSAAGATLASVSNAEGEYNFKELPADVYNLEIRLQGFKTTTRIVLFVSAKRRWRMSASNWPISRVLLTSWQMEPASTWLSRLQSQNSNNTHCKRFRLLTNVFRDALPLIPGVIRGPDGLLNIKGARASQSGLIVNSANVTDPVTGEFAINLPIEAIQSIQVSTNTYAAEYGNFTFSTPRLERAEV